MRRVRKEMPKEIEVFGQRLISRQALMEMTGCGTHVFQQEEKRAGLKKFKFGRQVYYPLEDAKAWVERKAA
jgi:hypothetical protein